MPLARLACAISTLILACIVVRPAAAQKSAAATDDFFKKHPLLHLSLEIAPKDMDSLRREPRKYVKATLKEGDKVIYKMYKDIGVHVKGAAGSTRSIDDKPGLTLNMDKFENEELFYGMDKFHLANSVQDGSYISELICGEMMRANGVPASRVGHAIVTINDKRRGFYYIKEGYDSSFLKANFKSKSGHFYDGGFLRDIDQPLQLVSGKEAMKPHEDLQKLLAASREGNPKERLAKMEQVLEMDKFITYLALEVLMWDWDGYPMNRNNYRIYHDPATNKLTFIPSGMDQMFHDPNGPLFPGIQGHIARAILDTPEGKERYLKRMDEMLKTTMRPEPWLKRLDELQAKVQPMLASVDPGAGKDYPNQVNRLKGAISHRTKKLQDEVTKQLNPKK